MIGKICCLLSLVVLTACATQPDSLADVNRRGITEMTQDILALGPGIDPEEAARAARVSLTYSTQLAREYQITDPPLVHNAKVNMGLRPRGLCYHWADDIEARLQQENFQTLDLHRAIANSTNIRIEHSTTIVSARGDTMENGLVVDPWRNGGRLFWSPVSKDSKYIWVRRAEVFHAKGWQ